MLRRQPPLKGIFVVECRIEGEARWRGLFARLQEGFALCEMVYGPDGEAVDYRHLELNAAWGWLTGLPVEAVQGRLASEATPGIPGKVDGRLAELLPKT